MKKSYILMIVLGFILLGSFPIYYQISKNETILLEENQETILSVTIDGSTSTTFPSKESGKTIESIECDNDAIGSWDYEIWGPVVRNLSKSRTKCQFHFVTKYHEEILNGTDPVLASGLIPVTIDNDGTVHKAYLGRDWYDYETQRWANAVILEDESVKYYEGDIIPEDNIESYFVWIPKYRYKLWDLGNYASWTSIQNKVQTINIIFGENDTKDSISGECTTPGVSGSSGNCSVGDYMTHPAFQAFGTKGLWIGKFEVGYKGATTISEAQQNVNNPEKVVVKPNVYSWRLIQIANEHLNSYNYKRKYDSHMMKNTEWGAVAYLQHSVYGSRASVRINNNANFITGYSATSEPLCGYTGINEECNQYEGTALNQDGTYTKRYNTEIGYLASTTKNITGVYDMSGGAYEYMMSMMLHSNGQPYVGYDSSKTSGFSGLYSGTSGSASGEALPESKYYDKYIYTSNSDRDYNRRILGDATGEMGPFANATYGNQTSKIGSWYVDESYSVDVNPWVARGGMNISGSGSGIFAFSKSCGNPVHGYRIVLAI